MTSITGHPLKLFKLLLRRAQYRFFFLRDISTVSPIYAFITLAPAYYTYNLGFKYLNTYRLEALQIFLWTYVIFTEANGPWKWLNE